MTAAPPFFRHKETIMRHDARGVPVTAGNDQSLDHYETALRQLASFEGDPVATLDAAIAADPQFVTGHLARALALLMTGERKVLPAVDAALAAADRPEAGPRDRLLSYAIQELAAGEWHAACRTIDRALIDYPCDLLALQAGHVFDFYRGDALNLRNRVTRVLPHWRASMPGLGFVLGMQAFGLEEMNQYPRAEATARRALALEPRDAWAIHAVAHVMEMEGRIGEGIAWLESKVDDWTPAAGLAFHNWWHLALFHLDGADAGRALELYDRHVHPGPAPFLLALVDATALLWRLQLEGVDVGRRFEGVADEWEAQIDAEGGFYAFNDFHAAMAFAACGRTGALDRLSRRMTASASGHSALATMTRDVGIPMVAGVAAFGRQRYREALAHLDPVRDGAHRFGGSHAQRDIISLTLIESALRCGDRALARHYTAERLGLKGAASRWGPRLAARAGFTGRHDATLPAARAA
jgi:tetratricopeptide (TPR) repeat protein